MPQPLTQPSHALPTKPIAQPYSRAATKEACHGREACCGRHNPRERERKVSKCTRWGRSVHHTHATAPHASLACIADKTYCTTVLTSCDELIRTREGNAWPRDIPQERKEGQQVHKMGQVCAPHPCHNPSPNPRMHCRQNLLHNRTHSLRRRKNDTGGKRVVGDITQEREKGRSASAQDGAGLCTTPMPQLLTQPSHALLTKPIAQPYSHAATKEP